MIVGSFVVLAFCAFLWMISIFGELPIAVSARRSFKVLVRFPEATGVQQNTPVKYCGYQIGRVTDVAPPEKEEGYPYHRVKVTLAIEKRYQDIPYNVNVKLMRRGLGSSYIEFCPSEEAVERFLSDGDVREGSTGISSEFFPAEVQKKLEDLVDSIAALTKNANDIIGDTENKTNLKQTLANITSATEQATETLKSMESFSDAGTESLASTAEQLKVTLLELRKLLVKINEGDGTAGRLVNDGRLYENLLDSSVELETTLEQLKILIAEAREKGIKVKL
jgi:phospholipid/cholesterol/gamma-HCH transport system substrate-binding protein